MNIYLDNASTSFPKPKIVAESVYDYILNIGGNSNRSNHSNALASNRIVYSARENICEFFNFDKIENVIFTNNITTSLNTIILGTLKSGDHVITSSMEHNSVLRPLTYLLKNNIISLDICNANIDGFIDVNNIEALIKPNTKMIITSTSSNVTGSIQPIKLLGELCKKHNILFVVDTAQGGGTLNINMKDFFIDALAFTGHKGLLGPQGIGGFIINDKINKICSPLVLGGTGSLSYSLEQPTYLPDKFESGTMNIPGIIGLSKGLDFIKNVSREEIYYKTSKLHKKLLSGINNISGFQIYGDKLGTNSCSALSFNKLNLDPSELSFYLEENGVKNRSGLHCAPLAHETIGTFPHGTVRLSVGYFNTDEEIDYTLNILNKL